MQVILDNLLNASRPFIKEGNVASYIPELGKKSKKDLGAYIITTEGKTACAGEWKSDFTMQSLVKPFLLLLALQENGIDGISKKMSVESTGKPFDAINMTDQKLLRDHVNPMVNMGAIELCTMIRGRSIAERFNKVLTFIRQLAGNDTIEIDEEVFRSERENGFKNKAMGYLLKAYGLIEEEPMDVLELYFRACSIKINCIDLAHMALVLAGHGVSPLISDRCFSEKHARFVNAILMTCGMYDGSGDFAVKVGIPAKSGVSGGIFGVVPGKMGIAIYGPSLDQKGNSVAGIKLLEKLSEELSLSIF